MPTPPPGNADDTSRVTLRDRARTLRTWGGRLLAAGRLPRAWGWAGPKLRWLLSGDRDRWHPLRLSLHVLLIAALALLAAVVLWEFFSARFPSPLPADLKVDVVRLVMYVIAGLGGVVALVIAYRRQRLGEAAALREHAADSREQTKAFNERFTAAAEQLSSDKAANRLAGVYAMASLADDWDQGRQTCINVLCAYLRMPYNPPEESPDLETAEVRKEHQERRAERQVRRTVMDVIGERLRADPIPDKTWHGSRFDLSGAVLDSGNLSGITIASGTIHFGDAVFPGGMVGFGGADFSGGTIYFGGATFSGGMVDFGGVEFSGGMVSFGGATFSGGIIDFIEAEFSGSSVDFGGAKFSGSTVDFIDTTFSGGTFNLRGATFSDNGVDFDGAAFCGALVHFDEAEFSGGTVGFVGAEFSGGRVDFGRTVFSDGTVGFVGAEFSGGTVSFDEAVFSGTLVHFDKAGFSSGRVDFGGVTLDAGLVGFGGAEFSGGTVSFNASQCSGGLVDVKEAEFSGGMVGFGGAEFSGSAVDFRGGAFSGGRVDFRGATFSGGTVDLLDPRDWSTPPTFDVFPRGTPIGLLLPDVETGHSQDAPRPDDEDPAPGDQGE